jgi:hypothetical protein
VCVRDALVSLLSIQGVSAIEAAQPATRAFVMMVRARQLSLYRMAASLSALSSSVVDGM